jgi:hypothetical protein
MAVSGHGRMVRVFNEAKNGIGVSRGNDEAILTDSSSNPPPSVFNVMFIQWM